MAAAGLFLRYCAACNSTQTVATRGKKGNVCGECGGPLAIRDAHQLIPALGNKLDVGQRTEATEACGVHDRP